MGKPVPNVPRRCRKVYDAMLLRNWHPLDDPEAWMREIDLINATGQSCAGVKLRELRRLNPGDWRYAPCDQAPQIILPPLVITKIRRSADGKRTWAEHRLSRSWKAV